MHHSIEGEIAAELRRWITLVARHAWLVLLSLGVLSLAAAYVAVRDLSINTDSSEMIDDQVPFRVNARRMQALFPQIHNQMLVILRGRSGDEVDFTARELARRLRGDSAHFSDVFAPAVDPFFQREGLLFLDYDELLDTSNRLSSAAPLLEKLVSEPTLAVFFEQLSKVARASEEGIDLSMVTPAYEEVARVVESVLAGAPVPLSWQALFGNDETLHQRVVTLAPVLDFGSLQPARPAVDALRRAVADLPPAYSEGVEIAITGDPVLRSDELRSVSDGIEISAVTSLVLVSLLLAFGLRSWQFVLASLLALLVSLALTAGFAAVAIGELNLVSIAFTVLLIGLGIDYSIHLVLHYREQLDHGVRPGEALGHTAHSLGPALLLAALTTLVAFLSFVPTRFVGMAQLGVISGAGILISWAVSLTVLPALLTLLPEHAPRPHRHRGPGWLARGLERWSLPVAALAVLLGIGAATLLPQVRFDADPMSLRDPESPSVKAFNLLFERKRDVPYRLNYVGRDLDDARAFARRVQALEEVEDTITLDDFVPEDQEDKLGEIDFLAGDLTFVLTEADDLEAMLSARRAVDRVAAEAAVEKLIDACRRIAADRSDPARARAAERLGAALTAFAARAAVAPELHEQLEERLLRFFPMQIDRLKLQLTARGVTVADLPPEIRRRYVAPGGEVRVEVLPAEDVRDPERRKAFVEAVATISPDLSGGAFTVLRGGEVVAESMVEATLTALALAALLILIVSRSVLFTLAVLAPLVLAGILTAATGVLIDLPFNFANVIVLPLLIGLGVDSGLHLVMRARRLRESGEVFVTSTPKAVLLSALTTIASFGSLALSHHRGTASMGELLMIAIAYTLLATLVVLPGLMAVIGRYLRPETVPPPAVKTEGAE